MYNTGPELCDQHNILMYAVAASSVFLAYDTSTTFESPSPVREEKFINSCSPRWSSVTARRSPSYIDIALHWIFH